MRLVLLLFMLPWWAYLPLAGGVYVLGEQVYRMEAEREITRSVALRSAPPPAMDLASFDLAQDRGMGDEVMVTGWINPDYNYTLVKRTNGVKTSESYLYMLFGVTEGTGATEVRAAIVFDEPEVDQFLAQYDEYIVGETEAGDAILMLNGFGQSYSAADKQVAGAMMDEGLRPAANFFYLTPFLDGREVALARTGQADQLRRFFILLAVAMVFWAAFKKVFRVGEKGNPDAGVVSGLTLSGKGQHYSAGADKAMTGDDFVFKANPQAVGLSKDIDPNSPLGRIATGQQARASYSADTSGLSPHAAALVALEQEKKARSGQPRKPRKRNKKVLAINFVVIVALAVISVTNREMLLFVLPIVGVYALWQAAFGRLRRLEDQMLEVIPQVQDFALREEGEVPSPAPSQPVDIPVAALTQGHAVPAAHAPHPAPRPATKPALSPASQPQVDAQPMAAPRASEPVQHAPAKQVTHQSRPQPARRKTASAPKSFSMKARDRMKADPFAKLAQEARGQ